MEYATRYKCTVCNTEKFLPERPLSPARSVQAGCNHCETITTHKPK